MVSCGFIACICYVHAGDEVGTTGNDSQLLFQEFVFWAFSCGLTRDLFQQDAFTFQFIILICVQFDEVMAHGISIGMAT